MVRKTENYFYNLNLYATTFSGLSRRSKLNQYDGNLTPDGSTDVRLLRPYGGLATTRRPLHGCHKVVLALRPCGGHCVAVARSQWPHDLEEAFVRLLHLTALPMLMLVGGQNCNFAYVDRLGFSVASEAHHDSFLQTDLLTFVKSTLHNPEGPNHCWLNGIGGSTKSNQDGILLLLIILSIKDLEIVGNRQHARGFQLAKLVQQRHPDVNIIIVCSGLLDAISDTAWIIKAVMEEFITFPILVLKKDFLQFPKIVQMSDHVGFLLCQGSIDHVVHLSGHNEIAVISKVLVIGQNESVLVLTCEQKWCCDFNAGFMSSAFNLVLVGLYAHVRSSVQISVIYLSCIYFSLFLISYFTFFIHAAIEEYSVHKDENNPPVQRSIMDKTSYDNMIKEPYFSPFRILLLHYPGSISIDEDGNRMFVSDSNHHRIIVSDSKGRILDCIGSSPGFEDGKFESAKLFRPAGSFYCPNENCLFFVDSENHAIRRADMENRVVETIYPASVQKSSGVWSWLLDKLGLGTKVVSEAGQLDLDLIKLPWHLLNMRENDLLTIDRSFETLWVVSRESGEIKKIVKGVSNVMEICGDMIMEKATLLKEISENLPPKTFHHCLSDERMCFSGWLSSVAMFQDDIIFCNADSQRIFRYHRESRVISYLQLSNLGVLGLPYWMVCPLERVIKRENKETILSEHIQHFNVLPGRCDILFDVNIPQDSELVAPVEKSCLWIHVRGSASEFSAVEEQKTGAGKDGIAQQWFDELDNLAFSQVEDETSSLDEGEHVERQFQDDRVHFNCSIGISPGTAEVVVSTVLYLKLKKTQENIEDRSSLAMRILECNKQKMSKLEADASTRLLLETFKDVEDLIFMKPVHIRLKLQCADHPTAVTNKETICTDSLINVDISLD
ncbi:hypothetical protein ZIOFF_025003 [Zingiber officinale]|uniref:NHL domain-containing protein n=1 Tax=Zingiber officinale TaxID=94328 RepID=A0A8J5H351_ZINOF|nr:hypothetical protein ZIOFF_025003 [Zingiber officinale]